MAWLDDQFKGFVDRDEGVDLIIYERPFARGQHATRSLWGIAGIIDAMARDEILEVEAREQLQEQGLDEESVSEALAVMRVEGMFDVPDWTLR